MEDYMDIYSSPEGTKVTVSEQSFNNGNDGDKANAVKYLRVGEVYTVDKIYIYGWRTEVHLKEFPGVSFNSVQFVKFGKNESVNKHLASATSLIDKVDVSKVIMDLVFVLKSANRSDLPGYESAMQNAEAALGMLKAFEKKGSGGDHPNLPEGVKIKIMIKLKMKK